MSCTTIDQGWPPPGCLDQNSCAEHKRCMYLGCKYRHVIESLEEFSMRVARFTGYDNRPQSDDWLRIKATVIANAAKALCHYRNGGGPANSCCNTKYKCRTAATAAAIIRFGDGAPVLGESS